MPTILIADDNRQIASVLAEYVKKEGYETTLAYDGDEAVERFGQEGTDLILLDVMMPKKDGFEVCREIRRISTVPIIMVTARGEDFERNMGLDIGADDYIVNPFSPGEVMVRVRAVLRRLHPEPSLGQVQKPAKIGCLTIDMERYKAAVNDHPVALKKRDGTFVDHSAESRAGLHP